MDGRKEAQFALNWFRNWKTPAAWLCSFVKWLALGLLMGGLGALAGAAFDVTLSWVNAVRAAHRLLLLALPLGGLLIVLAYRRCGLGDSRGVNELIEAFEARRDAPVLLGPLIFVGTAVTHLLGGSSGREGAALQIGGSLGTAVGRLLRLNDADRRILLVSGMSAVFAAVFGTPLTACLFSLEFLCVGRIFLPGLLPCLTASLCASELVQRMGIAPTRYALPQVLALNPGNLLRLVLLAAGVALVAIGFCHGMHRTASFLKRRLPNAYVRVALGGAIVAALSLVLRTSAYNGAGSEGIVRALAGEAKPWDFALKILFTALTLGAGYKGGEIVPTLFIGSSFGCVAAPLLGLDAGTGAALGMIGLFGCVTNCPLSAMTLAAELFGGQGLLPFAIMVAVGYALSGRTGLYESQRRTDACPAPDA